MLKLLKPYQRQNWTKQILQLFAELWFFFPIFFKDCCAKASRNGKCLQKTAWVSVGSTSGRTLAPEKWKGKTNWSSKWKSNFNTQFIHILYLHFCSTVVTRVMLRSLLFESIRLTLDGNSPGLVLNLCTARKSLDLCHHNVLYSSKVKLRAMQLLWINS